MTTYSYIFTSQFPWKPKSPASGFAPVAHVVFYRFLCCCIAGFQPNKRLSCCWQDCRQVLSSTEGGDMGLYATYHIDSTRIQEKTSIQVWHQHSNVKSSSRPCWEVLPYLLRYTNITWSVSAGTNLRPEATPNPDCSRFQKAAQEENGCGAMIDGD